VPKILAHTEMHKRNTGNIHKYLQQQNQARNIGALQNISEYIKYWHLMEILPDTQNIGVS
jgi:hypothetical protein